MKLRIRTKSGKFDNDNARTCLLVWENRIDEASASINELQTAGPSTPHKAAAN